LREAYIQIHGETNRVSGRTYNFDLTIGRGLLIVKDKISVVRELAVAIHPEAGKIIGA